MALKTRYPFVMMMFLLAAGCLDPYAPPKGGEANTLVVEAFIDAAAGTARVTLSRSTPLSSTKVPAAEQAATVTMEDDNGYGFSLPPTQPGTFEVSGLNLSFERKYRLIIHTA